MNVPTSIDTYRLCVSETFLVPWPGQEPVPLRLDRVELHHDTARQYVFSLFFHGPTSFLPQDTYELCHPRLGELALSIVPVRQLADGYEYQAAFNLLKDEPPTSNQKE